MVNSKFDLTVNASGDLVTKLRGMLNQFSKISNSEGERMPDDQINIILPPEMLEKILKLLKLKEICQAQLVCKTWKEIIARGNLVKKVAGKMLFTILLQNFKFP